MNLDGGGILAAEGRQLGGQALEAIVEALILAFEEHRDLTKRVSIVDLFDTQHTRTTSSLCARRKILLHRGDAERRGRQRQPPDERTAFENQLEFAHGEAQRRGRRWVAPQTREAALLQALGVNAQAGAVPE